MRNPTRPEPHQHPSKDGDSHIDRAPAVYVPKGLEANLGKDATALYRKALMTRNLGYGLAAVGYMRRVVEDKTNELIEVVAEFAETNNIDKAIVAQIRSALDVNRYTLYEKKLEIAAAVFPDKLEGRRHQSASGSIPAGQQGITWLERRRMREIIR